MHFKELHKGDHIYESAYGTSYETEVLTEPEETSPGVWEFRGRVFNDPDVHYLMRDDSTAYAPRLSRYVEYTMSVDLEGRKYYFGDLVDEAIRS